LVPNQAAVAAIETENPESQLGRWAGGTTARAEATPIWRSPAAAAAPEFGASLRAETLWLLPGLTANRFVTDRNRRDGEDTILPNHW
jgi:hypothetical protein